MIPDATPATLVILAFGAVSFILMMFLPALIELKRPKDAGPRRILGEDVKLGQYRTLPLGMIEEETAVAQTLVKKLADVIVILPNIET